eukprot:Partr_v1_DN22628_c0_g1_i1_m5319 putative NADH dehydrogenase (Ubiquinone) 1 alpha subcomplex
MSVGLSPFAIGIVRIESNQEDFSELKREKSYARLYLLPLVQAEWDRDWIRWRQDQLAKEEEIMKDVPGWKVGESVYHNSRWAPPRYDLDGNPVRPPIVRWIDSGEPL